MFTSGFEGFSIKWTVVDASYISRLSHVITRNSKCNQGSWSFMGIAIYVYNGKPKGHIIKDIKGIVMSELRHT